MKTLKQFYRELQEWIDDGCPEHEIFKRSKPLPEALRYWQYENNILTSLINELKDGFKAAERNPSYPFNWGGFWSWSDEVNNRTVYQNPVRLAWIKEHAA